MFKIQTPTVGRKVWFRPNGTKFLPRAGVSEYTGGPLAIVDASQPLDATVVHVWNDRMVNLLVLDQYGHPFCATSVKLIQEGDAVPNDGGGYYCEWMPYQKAQHAKAEEKPAAKSDPDDFPLGAACGVVDGTCEACQ